MDVSWTVIFVVVCTHSGVVDVMIPVAVALVVLSSGVSVMVTVVSIVNWLEVMIVVCVPLA